MIGKSTFGFGGMIIAWKQQSKMFAIVRGMSDMIHHLLSPDLHTPHSTPPVPVTSANRHNSMVKFSDFSFYIVSV